MKKLLILVLIISCGEVFGQEIIKGTNNKRFILTIENQSPFEIKIIFDKDLVKIISNGSSSNKIKTGAGESQYRAIYRYPILSDSEEIFSYRVIYYLKHDSNYNIAGDGIKKGSCYILNNKISPRLGGSVTIFVPDLKFIRPEIDKIEMLSTSSGKQ